MQISQESEEDIDIVDALFSEGTADYVDEYFFERKNQIGTLIVGASLPDYVVQHFYNIRECYSLGLFQTAIIYCRSVIETSCYEALLRSGKIKRDPKVPNIREFSLKDLVRDVKHLRLIDRHNWDRADAVIKKANGILHSKQKKAIVQKQEAFNAIQDTIAVVEEMFDGGQTRRPR